MPQPTNREEERLLVQEALDLAKTAEARNKLGQFATPGPLAREIIREAVAHLEIEHRDSPVRFLDPALGTGAFWSALRTVCPDVAASGVGIELDPAFSDASRRLWTATGLSVNRADFTQSNPPSREDDRFDLLVCNPPYVRHHHIATERKPLLKAGSAQAAGIDLSGLAGLYCHFLAHAHPWMKQGAIAAWLVPSEFMDVNYGAPLKQYLLDRVSLLRVHRFDPEEVQFSDALVSSAIVIFRNEAPPPGHEAVFSTGSKLGEPVKRRSLAIADLHPSDRWTQLVNDPQGETRRTAEPDRLMLDNLFTIRRGLVTGGNEFFVVSEQRANELQLPGDCLTPILPSPRYLADLEIFARTDGTPDIARPRFLVDCRLPPAEVEARYPELGRYLKSAPQTLRERYICQHRSPWYRQERRPAAPLLCTYLGRRNGSNRPFRFILNHSNATAANVYHLLYPLPRLASAMEAQPDLLRQIWRYLNTVDVEELLRESRVYGGGLYKLEPRELDRISLHGLEPDLRRLIGESGVPEFPAAQLALPHQFAQGVQFHP